MTGEEVIRMFKELNINDIYPASGITQTYLKRAIVAYPLLKSGQFRLLGINTICSHCLDYCTRMGMVYLKGVGYCLLSSSR